MEHTLPDRLEFHISGDDYNRVSEEMGKVGIPPHKTELNPVIAAIERTYSGAKARYQCTRGEIVVSYEKTYSVNAAGLDVIYNNTITNDTVILEAQP